MGVVKILFVCLGNICRSPMAEGVFRNLVESKGIADKFVIDSAGTGAWHVGADPDDRAQSVLLANGMDISGLRARQITEKDFDAFDLIIAMDRSNYNNIVKLDPEAAEGKVHMMLGFAPHLNKEDVPDPYYGGDEGFEHVLYLVREASEVILASLDIKSD